MKLSQSIFKLTAVICFIIQLLSCSKKDPPGNSPGSDFKFSLVSSPTWQTNLSQIAFSDQTGYVAGSDGIYKSVDGGSSWLKILTTYPSMTAIYVVNKDIVYAGSYGVIKKTTNGGNTWINLMLPLGNSVFSIYFLNENTGYVAQGGIKDKIYKTTDGGNSWTALFFPNGYSQPTSIHFINEQQGYVARGDIFLTNEPGDVLRTSDGGASWIYYPPIKNGYSSIFFLTGNLGFATTLNGNIIKIENSGLTWTTLSVNNTNPIRHIHFADTNTGVAVGDNGIVFSTTNSGKTWKKDSTDLIGTIPGVYLVNPYLGCMIGDGGKIVRFTR